MAPLFSENYRAILEAVLFAAGEPVNLKTLAEVLELPAEDVRELLVDLGDFYREHQSGLVLEEIGGGFALVTRPDLACYLSRLYKPQVSALSQAALETLAIIAYRQPVTRGEIEQIRGVKADHVLGTLMEKKLVCEVGRREGPGRPVLYGTTGEFLRHFGLKDLTDLPPLLANREEAGTQ